MADYYPILTRAIGGLEANTGEARRSVYDRARTALVAQLRGFDPPLPDADIKRERLSLEESIRRVEAEHRELEGEVREAFGRSATEPQLDRRQTPIARLPEPAAVQPPPVAAFPVPEDAAEAAETGSDKERRRERREKRRPKRDAASRNEFTRDAVKEDATPARSRLPAIIGSAVLLLLLLGGVAAYLMRDQLFGDPSQAVVETSVPQGKISDRVQQGSDGLAVAPSTVPPAATAPASPAAAPAAPAVQSGAASPVVATQRAVLYEENGDPQGGSTFDGTATWSVEATSSGQGQPPETALRGEIDIPTRFSAVLLLRRNTDSTLPASHTIEIQFNLPPNFSNAGIANVPGLIMKTDEQAQGAALAGLSVRVTGGVFLIGLSNLESERNSNEQLLRDRPWIDIPILYDNGRRAVLTLEKGAVGSKAFADALAAWRSAGSVNAAPVSGSVTTPQ